MTVALRPNELRSIRKDVQAFMPETVDVYEVIRTRTSNGGTLITYPNTPTRTLRGGLGPMGGSDTAFYAEKLGSRMGWVFTLPFDSVVLNNMHFGIGDRRFEVLGNDTIRATPLNVRVFCRELL